MRSRLRRYAWVLVAASPLGVYELVALLTRRVPTITDSWRETQRRHIAARVVLAAAWIALTTHFLLEWP